MQTLLYFIVFHASGDEPMAMRAAAAEQIRCLYPDVALVAQTTLSELRAAGWDDGGIEDVEAHLYGQLIDEIGRVADACESYQQACA